MSKSLLLIDDKEDFKEDFKTTAQRKGYNLAWGKSFEDLENKLPQLYNKIVAVVLDIKCLMKNDQEIENEDFIGYALTLLNSQYPDLPKVILTGDEEAFGGLSKYFKNEKIFRKDPDDIINMFEVIEEFSLEHENRIKSNDEKIFYKIIEEDEGKKLEFKSSLQFNTKEKIKDKSLNFDVLKAIAAFANTEGGTLLIGVEDNKNIYGLEDGDFTTITAENKKDAYKLLIDNLIRENFGGAFHNNLEEIKFYQIKQKTICKITVKEKYQNPVYIKKSVPNKPKYEAFFIRGQAGSPELKNEEKDKYISNHWKLQNS